MHLYQQWVNDLAVLIVSAMCTKSEITLSFWCYSYVGSIYAATAHASQPINID